MHFAACSVVYSCPWTNNILFLFFSLFMMQGLAGNDNISFYYMLLYLGLFICPEAFIVVYFDFYLLLSVISTDYVIVGHLIIINDYFHISYHII